MESGFYRDFVNKLMLKMIEFDRGDAKRVQHFVKVHSFAALIAEEERLSARSRFIIECAAILHDIGIHPAEQKYGSSAGHLQEREGPPYARALLEQTRADFVQDAAGEAISDEEIERVCFLIAHHHTYTSIQGDDWQILVEADFLVNIYEDNFTCENVKKTCERVFKTRTGKALCEEIYFPET